jgi:hypothetical protein
MYYNSESYSFSVPRKEEIRAKWLSVIQREVKNHSAVCSRHFLETDFYYKVVGDHVRRFLLPAAIPSASCIHSDRYTFDLQISIIQFIIQII